MRRKNIIAVIPAHNEENHIFKVVKETKKHVDTVIVVDDASTDRTSELAKQAGAISLRHIVNLQKGAALKTGCEAAILLGADVIVMVDGDGQHNPKEIPLLVNKLNKVDFVFGSRNFDKNMPFVSRIGNKFLSALANFLYGRKITDSQTGYRAFNTRVYKKVVWNSRDYAVESEVIKNVGKNNISYDEVKVSTIYNDKYKGTTPLDGIKIAINMVRGKFA